MIDEKREDFGIGLDVVSFPWYEYILSAYVQERVDNVHEAGSLVDVFEFYVCRVKVDGALACFVDHVDGSAIH